MSMQFLGLLLEYVCLPKAFRVDLICHLIGHKGIPYSPTQRGQTCGPSDARSYNIINQVGLLLLM